LNLEKLLIDILKSSKELDIWSLPTNPITAILYFAFSVYGFYKLKGLIRKKDRLSTKFLYFLYAVCILGFINFLLENVWLTFFYLRFMYFNDGWMEHMYLSVPAGFYLNYLRNFGCMLILFVLSADMWKHIHFNRQVISGILLMTLFLFLYFFWSPSYAYIDWYYGLYWGFDESIIVRGFTIALMGKPILFYIYSGLFKEQVK